MNDNTTSQAEIEARLRWAAEKEKAAGSLEAIIADAAELLAEIMRDEVNHQDEAEKWLRAYAPQHLFPENADGERPRERKANER